MDAHTHSDIRFGWNHSTKILLSMMDKAGISRAIVTTYSDLPCADDPFAYQRFLDTIDKNETRFLGGYFRANPWYGNKTLSLFKESLTAHNVVGLKIHPVTILMTPNSDMIIELVDEAVKHDAITLIHTGDEPLSLPQHVEKLAQKCKKANILMAHMGGNFYWTEAIRVAKRNRNIYLETSGMPVVRAIARAIEELGPEKIIFGSDAPAADPLVELAKIESLEIPALDKVKITSKNILGLMSG